MHLRSLILAQCGWLLIPALTPALKAAVIPQTPGYFQVTPGDAQVSLSWQSTGASYHVKRSLTLAGPLSIMASNLTQTTWVDTNVVNGRLYFYAVSGAAGDVESPDTVRLRVTPSAPVLDWLPGGAKVEKLAGNFQFTEGPAWLRDPAGDYLVFSDIPVNRLVKWTPQGATTFRPASGAANGNTVDLQGRLVTCEHSNERVSRTESDGTVTALVTEYNGRRFNSPNDAVVKSDGTIWFTDPTYGGTGQPGRYVYRCDPADGNGTVTPVVTNSDQPNGLCFSPDEKILYIADSGTPHHVRALDVLPDNTLANSRVYVVISPGAPDGIRADSTGRLYFTAGDGVQIFSPEGDLLGKLRTPETAANVGFGGPNNEMMFITAQTSLYAVSRKPDLVVTAIIAAPLQPIVGQRTAFTVVVKNQGTTPAAPGFAVSLVLTNSVGTNEMAIAPLIEALAPDASIALPLAAERGFWPATPGTSGVLALVDSANALAESNETNNLFRTSVSVLELPLDTDGDGASDADETIVGTAGDSAQSALQILSATWQPAGGLLLRWSSVPERSYRVAAKGSLTDLIWTDVSGIIPAAGAQTSWMDPGPQAGPGAFYRIRFVAP